MSQPPRYLTKSRFKQALECPTKLFYTGKREYLNNSLEDSFLMALAEGGYQVGALAQKMYSGGATVDDLGHSAQLKRTQELLAHDNVTVYEAAFEAEGLFVRVDILRKCGSVIDLIEVKAKSYNSVEDDKFLSNRGKIKPEFLPYLQDIAFQRYVAGLAFPQFAYRCFLMMADTALTATVDGLNQQFRVRRDGQRIAVDVAASIDVADLGEPVLTEVNVDAHVRRILDGEVAVRTVRLPFVDAVREFADAYRTDRRIDPIPGVACGSCEFRASTPPRQAQPRSGFHECWSTAFGWHEADFAGGTVLDIWNFRKKGQLIQQGVLKLSQVTEEHLDFDGSKPGARGMSAKHRQWYQCSGQWPGSGSFYLNRRALMHAMQAWRYPLHFIDFETSTAPIPFNKGRRPYETTAFQFSHHVLHADGRVVHESQFLDATPRRSPNVAFLRELRDALENDDGTVFRWAAHENTVLTHLRRQLLDDASPSADAPLLVKFVENLTTRKVDRREVVGLRSMVDLCKLSEKHFFHPMTEGSSSLKKVLPALMSSSAFLRETYGRPVYGSKVMPSRNLSEPVAWWQEVDGKICDPYDLLPPVFTDLSRNEQDAYEAGLAPELQEGGAAMAAYARLQFEDLDANQRQAIEAALLRYCELDTLAMVMVVQAWKAWAQQ